MENDNPFFYRIESFSGGSMCKTLGQSPNYFSPKFMVLCVCVCGRGGNVGKKGWRPILRGLCPIQGILDPLLHVLF